MGCIPPRESSWMKLRSCFYVENEMHDSGSLGDDFGWPGLVLGEDGAR